MPHTDTVYVIECRKPKGHQKSWTLLAGVYGCLVAFEYESDANRFVCNAVDDEGREYRVIPFIRGEAVSALSAAS
jgi:hypothetical protein